MGLMVGWMMHWTIIARSGSQVDVRCNGCGATARLSAIVVQAPRPPRCTRCGAQTVPGQQPPVPALAAVQPEPPPAPVIQRKQKRKPGELPAYRKPNSKPRVALTGSVWGRLTVIAVDGVMRTVQCECGTVKSVPSGSLVIGYVRSCGCLARDTKTKYVVGKEVRGMIVVSVTERRVQMRCQHCGNVRDVLRGNAHACRCSCQRA